MSTARTGFLRQRNYLAVAISHFFVDVLNSSRLLLVAILAISIGLSNAQVGIVLLLYNVGNALSQPFFGLLADRIGARWLVIGGVGWMIFFFSLAALAPEWPALIALTVAGLGSGAFHPTGTMVASQSSHHRRTQATAVFFFSGQIGLFTGPIIAGILLQQLGRPGYLILPILAFIAFASDWQWLSKAHVHHHHEEEQKKPGRVEETGDPLPPAIFYRRAIPLAVIIICVGTVSISTISFAPKLFTELGFEPFYVGVLSGAIMLGSAVGGIIGGTLADRWNGRAVIFFAALSSILPIYFYIPVEGYGRLFLLLLAGFFVGMPHSIIVLTAQSLLPGKRAFASGLTLGFMFFTGSVGSYFVGVVADNIGLALALQFLAVLPLLTATMAWLLPKQEAANQVA